MAFWNSTELFQPPSNTCRANVSMNDIHKLNLAFKSITNTFRELRPLHVEAAMLSRTIYKLKSKFHTDVGFQKLEKINRALLSYHSADFPSVYSQFVIMLPGTDQLSGTETYMPTRQMLEWVLVRTQGFARLFVVIAMTCEESAKFWLNRITIAQSWNVSTLVMGVIGRIWSYAKYLVVAACKWYSELQPFVDILRPNGLPWAPEDYKFPEDLKLWLKVPSITDVEQTKPDGTSEQKTAFSMLDTSKDVALKELGIGSSDIQRNEDVDLGESISRDEMQRLNRGVQKKKLKKFKNAASEKVRTKAGKESSKSNKKNRRKKRKEAADLDEKINVAKKERKTLKFGKKHKDVTGLK